MSLGTTNLLASGPGNSVGGGVVFSGKRQLCFGVWDPKQLSIQIKNEKAIMKDCPGKQRVTGLWLRLVWNMIAVSKGSSGRENREKNSKSALATILVLVDFGAEKFLLS